MPEASIGSKRPNSNSASNSKAAAYVNPAATKQLSQSHFVSPPTADQKPPNKRVSLTPKRYDDPFEAAASDLLEQIIDQIELELEPDTSADDAPSTTKKDTFKK